MTHEIQFKDKLVTSHDVKISMEAQTVIMLSVSAIILLWMLKRKK